MKATPMIFNTEMVRALLNLIKKQTRRPDGLKNVNYDPDYWKFIGFVGGFEGSPLRALFKHDLTDGVVEVKSKYGNFPHNAVSSISNGILGNISKNKHPVVER